MNSLKIIVIGVLVLATTQVFAASELMRSLRKTQPMASVKIVDGSGNTAQSREKLTVVNTFENKDVMSEKMAEVKSKKYRAPIAKVRKPLLKVVPASDPTPSVSAAWNKALSIGTRYRFGYNSTRLTRTQKTKLSAIAKTLGKSGQNYSIVGFADSTGNAAYNEALSLKRANAVKNYLVSQGFRPEALLVQGGGERTDVSATAARVVEIEAL